MRLFFALDLSEKALAYAENMANQLQPHLLSGRITPRKRLHVTLAFLGEVDPVYLLSLKNLLKDTDLSQETGSFQSLDLFGEGTVVAKLKVSRGVKELAARLRKESLACGLSPDEKPFRPHVTLARNCHSELPFSELKKNILVFNKPFSFAGVGLYCSETIDGKHFYTKL